MKQGKKRKKVTFLDFQKKRKTRFKKRKGL